MNTNSSFGTWLRQRRKALDLTQADLAEQVGCARTTIQKFELGKRRPSKQIVDRLADVLAISMEERTTFVAFARQMPLDPASLSVDLAAITPAHNLPSDPTPFLGRETELAQIAERLNDPHCRLLTLVGPGGFGKTRLALQAAAKHQVDFADGAHFVPLAPVGSTGLIAAAIASVLQFSFRSQEDTNVQLVGYLRGKHILLIMDNCEHLLGGIGLLTDILEHAPRLKILATSRERLNLQEEWTLPVKGLSFPAQEIDGELSNYSAIRLFMQSARRVQPDFSLRLNQAGVIAICQAVEGMPLAIELAATWLRMLRCDQIAEQIQHDLDFLTTPLRNVPERHRSLRAVFEHSWSLLSKTERSVLMQLTVFRGGFEREAAQQVAGASLSMLAGLVDKSLVQVQTSGRYAMHELLRQFAGEKLLAIDQTSETQHRHFEFFLSLAEDLEPRITGPEHVATLDRLEADHDNLRVALSRIALSDDTTSSLRLAGALGWFWNFRTYWSEGRQSLEHFLSVGQNVPYPVCARALHHAIELSSHLRDDEHTEVLCEHALTLAPAVEDERLVAWLLGSVGNADGPHRQRRLAYMNDALARFRKLGDNWSICITLSRLGGINIQYGDFVRAGELLEEGIGLARQAEDHSSLSWLLFASGCLHFRQGGLDQRTENYFQESLTLFHAQHHMYGIARALAFLGRIAHLRGEDERAQQLYARSLVHNQHIGSKAYIAWLLIWQAELLSTHEQAGRAAHLLGSVKDAVQILAGGSILDENIDKMDYERALAVTRAQLDELAFNAAWEQGRAMTMEQAIVYALGHT
jgi:predicted ATPase/DNA-binding XRE family transcriptional regulator